MEITAVPPQGEICDGTGSQFLCFGVIYLCTKFHVFYHKMHDWFSYPEPIRWTKLYTVKLEVSVKSVG